MTRLWSRAGLWVVAMSILLGCVPAAFAQITFPPAQPILPPPPPSPATDPRLDQIRQLLERQGLKVQSVRFLPDQQPPKWAAFVEATYAQPSFDRITQLAFVIWNALYTVLGDREPPHTYYTSAHVWNKYYIMLHAPRSDLTTLVNVLRTARTQQEQQRAYQVFLNTTKFYVFDIEREQFVDQKDFVNKNFAR